MGLAGESLRRDRGERVYAIKGANPYTELETRYATRGMVWTMKSTTRTLNVRISPRAHELLRQLAQEEQQSMLAVLDRAIERYRRERFLRGANADFAELKGDAKAWKRELRDRELWETTVADGISKE